MSENSAKSDTRTLDDLVDELNDTVALRCCNCPSCNHYAPDFAEHEGEPCRTWELIRAYADAYCRETHVSQARRDGGPK